MHHHTQEGYRRSNLSGETVRSGAHQYLFGGTDPYMGDGWVQEIHVDTRNRNLVVVIDLSFAMSVTVRILHMTTHNAQRM